MPNYGDQLHLRNLSTGAETTDIMWVVRRGSVVPVELGFELSGGDFTLTTGDLTVEAGNAYFNKAEAAVDTNTGTIQTQGGISADLSCWFGDDILIDGMSTWDKGALTINHTVNSYTVNGPSGQVFQVSSSDFLFQEDSGLDFYLESTAVLDVNIFFKNTTYTWGLEMSSTGSFAFTNGGAKIIEFSQSTQEIELNDSGGWDVVIEKDSGSDAYRWDTNLETHTFDDTININRTASGGSAFLNFQEGGTTYARIRYGVATDALRIETQGVNTDLLINSANDLNIYSADVFTRGNWTFNNNNSSVDWTVNSSSGIAMFYDESEGTLLLNTVVTETSSVSTEVSSSTTETIDVTTCNEIDILVSGNTLSLSNMSDRQQLQLRNRSTGDAFLNFDIELQGTVYLAPVTMAAGEAFELSYDLGNTRWVI